MQRRTTLLLSTITLGAACAAGAAIGSGAIGQGASGPPTGTLEFEFKDPSAKGFGSNPAKPGAKPGPPRAGDIITVRGPISMGGAKAGTEYATLTFQGGPPTFQAVFAFNDGSTLVAAGVTSQDGPATSAIIGGTGIYAGARGEITETVIDAKAKRYRETVRFIP